MEQNPLLDTRNDTCLRGENSEMIDHTFWKCRIYEGPRQILYLLGVESFSELIYKF